MKRSEVPIWYIVLFASLNFLMPVFFGLYFEIPVKTFGFLFGVVAGIYSLFLLVMARMYRS